MLIICLRLFWINLEGRGEGQHNSYKTEKISKNLSLKTSVECQCTNPKTVLYQPRYLSASDHSKAM